MTNLCFAELSQQELMEIEGGVKAGWVCSGLVCIAASGGNPGLIIAGAIMVVAGLAY